MAKKKSNRKEHHVVPNKKGGWDVKINNAGHRTYHTRKKSTAIKKARAISRKHGSELVIHNSKGRIEVKNSHDVIRRGKPGPKKRKLKRKVRKVARRKIRKTRKVARRANKRARKAVRRYNKRSRKVTRRNVRKARRTVRRAKRKTRKAVRRYIRRRR